MSPAWLPGICTSSKAEEKGALGAGVRRQQNKGHSRSAPRDGDPNTARHSVLEAAGAQRSHGSQGDSRTAGGFLVKVRKWHVFERFLSES